MTELSLTHHGGNMARRRDGIGLLSGLLFVGCAQAAYASSMWDQPTRDQILAGSAGIAAWMGIGRQAILPKDKFELRNAIGSVMLGIGNSIIVTLIGLDYASAHPLTVMVAGVVTGISGPEGFTALLKLIKAVGNG